MCNEDYTLNSINKGTTLIIVFPEVPKNPLRHELKWKAKRIDIKNSNDRAYLRRNIFPEIPKNLCTMN